jgi:hypothetical protein
MRLALRSLFAGAIGLALGLACSRHYSMQIVVGTSNVVRIDHWTGRVTVTGGGSPEWYTLGEPEPVHSSPAATRITAYDDLPSATNPPTTDEFGGVRVK